MTTFRFGKLAASAVLCTAALLRGQAPSVTTPPADQTVAGGTTANFSVAATGAAPLAYQWYRDGLPLSGQTGAALAVANAQLANVGNYTVAVSNTSGIALSLPGRLALAAAPAFTGVSSGAGLIVAQGAAASITVAVTGNPAPTLQWFKEGVLLTGKTAATLSFASAQPADAGNYTVTATNASGSATSTTIELTVEQIGSGTGPLAITTSGGTQVNGNIDPATGILTASVTTGGPSAVVAPRMNAIGATGGLFLNQGANATLSASVTGTPAPALQWLKDGVVIPGATNLSLAFTNVQPSDAASYSLRATNSVTTVTSNAVLVTVASLGTNGSVAIAGGNGQVVNGAYNLTTGVLSGGVTTGGINATVAPKIGGIVSKSDLLLQVGSSASLAVVATGSPAPTFQWLKDGVVLPGATSSTYAIASVATSDAGRYAVRATNSTSTVTSDTVDVSVTSLVAGSGNLAIATAGGTSISGTVDATTGALTAGVTTGATAGTTLAPQIVSFSAKGGLFLSQGSTATLTARATGNPLPTYQWFKNTSAISGATAPSLTLTNVQPTDAATYSVRATNAGGNVTSENVLVTVANLGANGSVAIAGGDGQVINANYNTSTGTLAGGVTSGGPNAVVAPKLNGITSKSDLLLEIGKAATLSVVATGNPAPTYQWFKDGTPLAGATGTTFSIASVGASDAGAYTVRATNSAGNATSATLGVSATSLTSGGGSLVVATSGGTRIAGTVDAATGVLNASVTMGAATALAPQIPSFTARGGLFINQGSAATLTASSSGNPLPTYQWFKNTVAIPGATGASFTITNAQPTDAANYTVRVANAGGNVTSENVPVTVANLGTDGAVAIAGGDGRVINANYNPSTGLLAGGVTTGGPTAIVAPKIEGIVSKSDVLLEAGKPATLSVVATGSPAPTYQWLRDGVPIVGATGSIYSIASVSNADAGRYTVTATNSAGAASSVAVEVSVTNLSSGSGNLSIATGAGTRINGSVDATTGALTAGVTTGASAATALAPKIASLSAKGGVFVNQGSTATLSATATGNPPPTYAWFKNNVAIPGATSPKLTLANVQPVDAGSYAVRATNASGNVTSESVFLTVAAIGADGSVAITGGDGQVINAAYNTTTGALNGGVTAGGPNALVLPRIGGIVSKSDLLLEVGSRATLAVIATGKPTPAFQWFRDTVAIAGATGTNYSINSVSVGDAGRYTVRATNTSGTVTSTSVDVSVTTLASGSGNLTIATGGGTSIVGSVDPTTGALTAGVTVGATASSSLAPQIASLTAKGGLFINQGSSATLTVSATGNPPPSFQWLKDTAVIPGATNGSFAFTNTQPGDAGSYTVRVTNAGGTLTSDPILITVASIGGDGSLSIAGGNGQVINGAYNPTTGALSAGVTTGGANAVVAPKVDGISSQADLLLELGRPALFSVGATGNPVPTFQWYREGALLAGATNSTYAITAATTSDSGNYTVVATNAAGAVTSVTLSVSVTSRIGGSGPLTIATSGGTRISGAVDSLTGALSAGVTTNANSGSNAAGVSPTVVSLSARGAVKINQGESFTLAASATGNPAPTYQWYRGDTLLSGQTKPKLTIANAQPSDSGGYVVRAVNAGGTTVSEPTQVTVVAPDPADGAVAAGPLIESVRSTPTGLLAQRGDSVTLAATIDAEPAAGFQWLKDGAAIAGATNATLTLANVQESAVGGYAVRATNSEGSVTSGAFLLTVANLGADGQVAIASPTGNRVDARYDLATGALTGTLSPLAGGRAPSVQSVTSAPGSLLLNVGASTTLSVLATGSPLPTYQWFKNDTLLAGATGATLSLVGVTLGDAGVYTVRATNSAGVVTGGSTNVSVVAIGANGQVSLAAAGGTKINGSVSGGGTPTTPGNPGSPGNPGNPDNPAIIASRLTNLSVRGVVTPANPAIVTGFVVSGEGTRQLLVRAIGPGLTAFGVTGALARPALALTRGGASVAANTGYTTAANSAAIVQTGAAVGAFPLGATAADSAVLTPAGAGAYSATVTGAGGATGETLVELYDATPIDAAGARLVNLSSSQQLASAQSLTAGFVVNGTTTRRVLVRAIGPTLTRTFGVPGTLPAPVLTVSSGATILQTNQNWNTSADASAIAAAAGLSGAFPLAAGAPDSAVLLTLTAGAYNIQVRDANGAAGLAMVEIYELP